jgi:hypothetical protein
MANDLPLRNFIAKKYDKNGLFGAYERGLIDEKSSLWRLASEF